MLSTLYIKITLFIYLLVYLFIYLFAQLCIYLFIEFIAQLFIYELIDEARATIAKKRVNNDSLSRYC